MRTPTRIIFTVTNDLSYDQRMIRICSSLVEAGYRVILVGRQRAQSVPLLDRPFQQKRLRCYFEQGKLFYAEYNLRLFFYLLFASCDIIASIDLDTLLPGFLCGKIRGKAVVYDAHEYFTEVPEVVRRPKVKRVWEGLANGLIPRIQFCYTVGEGLAGIFEERYGRPFEVIRNVPWAQGEGWEIERVEPPVILYQGVLNEGRGLEAMLQAMPLISNAQLWLAGEGDLSEALRRQSEELGLGARVRFWGYLQPEELHRLTPQASIGINLLENRGLNYYYSLANKTFDYIQAGLPALHMNFPEYAAINRQYEVALLMDNLNPQQLAKAINRLLEQPELYAQLQANCRLAARELTWEKEQARLIAFYQRIKDGF
ncbi:MAG: glycosyltransferase family 4 protein [Bacteroidota bacterium]